MRTTDQTATHLSPRAREIVAVARELLEEEGVEALSTRRLAHRLGIRAPSLYSHFANKQELENALITEGLWELGDRLNDALAAGDDPIIDLMAAYRTFAGEHPHLFRLIYRQPWDRTQLDPAAELHTRTAIWAATNHDIVAARVIWALAYGLIELELDGRFPVGGPSIDELWQSGLAALKAGLPMSAPAR
jgi:AcrR family transcriptional regulator